MDDSGAYWYLTASSTESNPSGRESRRFIMLGRASSVNPRENVSGPHFDSEECFTFDYIEHRNSSDPVFPLL